MGWRQIKIFKISYGEAPTNSAAAVVFAIGIAMSAGCANSAVGGFSLHEAFPDDKVAALVWATTAGNYADADKLRNAGVDVNARGNQGITPLAWLVAADNKTAVEYLLQAGADPNLKSLRAQTSPLSLAVEIGSPEMVALLLKYRGDPNLLGSDSEPLLHLAVRKQRKDQIDVLLEHGADVNIYSNRTAGTAADIAADVGRFDIVAYLLEKGLSYDLQGLAKTVEIIRVPPKSEQDHWKNKVIEMLKVRGVKFPAFTPKKPNPPSSST